MAEADDALGEDLSGLCFDGPGERLVLTENTQPAILAVSVAVLPRCWRRAASRRPSSPGTASASTRRTWRRARMAFADALRTVRRRGRYMQEAVPVGQGAMAAILGLDAATVAQACDEAAQGEVVSPANLNAPGQVVIAGSKDAVARAIGARQGAGREARDPAAGERAVPLRADEARRGRGWRRSCGR